MNSPLGKLALIILAIVAYLVYSNKQSDKASQEKLQQEISALKQQVIEQEESAKLNSQKQIQQAEKQLAESKQQSQKIDTQIQELNKVTEDLAKKQKIEQEMMDQAQITRDETLKATYIAQGLQTASMLKMAIAEYYMNNGEFPQNNATLGIAKPTSFSSGSVKSIWVTKGKISIIYNDKTGIDKGTLNLTPIEKNYQLQWQCTTPDFKNISRYMPTCHYKS